MIALLDYGAGNLTSVRKAFAAIGADICVPSSPGQLEGAAAAVVPGVGHFGATRALSGDWTNAVRGLVRKGRPLLGICLGMQWLFEGSDEAPEVRGIGIFPGRIVRLDPRACGAPDAHGAALKVPHVGWNSIAISHRAPIVEHVADGAQVYFTHSYVAPLIADTVGVTTHGAAFTSIVQRGPVAGVQFHPEKSGEPGLQLLRNFAAMVR